MWPELAAAAPAWLWGQGQGQGQGQGAMDDADAAAAAGFGFDAPDPPPAAATTTITITTTSATSAADAPPVPVPLPASKKGSAALDEPSYVRETFELLNGFLHKAPVGEFPTRLHLVRVFALQVGAIVCVGTASCVLLCGCMPCLVDALICCVTASVLTISLTASPLPSL